MIENTKNLNRDDILHLFKKLDDELVRRGHRVIIYVVGGANIALAVDDLRTTTDIDVVVKRGFDVIFDAVRAVASQEPGIGNDWLNATFTGDTQNGGITWIWFDNRDSDTPSTGFKGSALLVELASPEMMLALKTLSQRPQDMEDIYTLMRLTGIKTPEGIGRNLARFTGRRIFEAQGKPGMFIHIDPNFRAIFDGIPEDLAEYTHRNTLTYRMRNWLGRYRRSSSKKHNNMDKTIISQKSSRYDTPRCGAWMPRTKARCGRPRGHRGSHRR